MGAYRYGVLLLAMGLVSACTSHELPPPAPGTPAPGLLETLAVHRDGGTGDAPGVTGQPEPSR
jgi:hypothetical protein